MKSNNEILDTFGELITHEVFDNQYKFILNKVDDLAQTKEYENLFRNMDQTQKTEIEKYTQEILKGCLFDFLRVFEENEEFRIIYQNKEVQADLNKISEMLKAEPIIENGWIVRFSERLGNSSET